MTLDPSSAPLEALRLALGGPQPAKPFLVLPDLFSPGLCDDLLYAHRLGGQRSSGFMWSSQEVIREDVKQRVDVNITGHLTSIIETALWTSHMYAAEVAMGIDLEQCERHLVARYDAPSGHFAPHRDNVFPGLSHRKVALTINLSHPEDYEGGTLVLPECGARIKAPRGAAVLFAASTLHGVEPVTRGSRYAYLTFLF